MSAVQAGSVEMVELREVSSDAPRLCSGFKDCPNAAVAEIVHIPCMLPGDTVCAEHLAKWRVLTAVWGNPEHNSCDVAGGGYLELPVGGAA